MGFLWLARVAKEVKICFTKNRLVMENQAQKSPQPTQQPVVHTFQGGGPRHNSSVASPAKVLGILFIVAVVGVGSGFALSQVSAKTGTKILPGPAGQAPKGKIVGSNDTKTFKDTAVGVLKNGGINGEGQYHLERDGGASQNVYMTSSIVDLSPFVGQKIKVWGETQKAQSAGWLMDVGRVEVQ